MPNQICEPNQSPHELQVYPNPENHSIMLFFGVPEDFFGKSAGLEIYSMAGRLVWHAEEPVSPGLNKTVWKGIDNAGHKVTQGKYIVKVSLERKVLEKDFTLIR
jgi:hypothetical protein